MNRNSLIAAIGTLVVAGCSSTDQAATVAEAPGEVAKSQVAIEGSITSRIDGGSLFTEKGCVACHQEQSKTVGPSLVQIASAYEHNETHLIQFLSAESDPIVDPAMFNVMQPQITVTKALPKAERVALAQFILNR